MASGHIQGQVLRMLVQMIRPRLVLEIGTFTGYSALAMASALEPGAMLHTFEINDEQEDFTRPWIEGSPWADRVTFHIGNALEEMKECLHNDKSVNCKSVNCKSVNCKLFDLVFIDADKRHYVDYYRAVLPYVRPGGYILTDNTLWGGQVINVEAADVNRRPDDAPHNGKEAQLQGICAFNDLVAADTSVEKVILPVRDGLTIIRKLDS